MTAFPRPVAATVLMAAAALVLAGCASADPAPVADAPPASTAPAEPDAEDTATESGDEQDAGSSDSGEDTAADGGTAQAGAYVDYRDGIIAETPGTKALFFHAPWCPQCRALEESILSGDIPDGLTIIKTDYDTETGLRQQYGVTLQTTIVFVDDDGEALSSSVLYSDTTLDALVAAAP